MNCSGRTNLEQESEAFFTARQQSCGKVMFPVVSVCPQGWAPVQGPDPGYSTQGQGPHPHYRTQPWHPLYRTLAQPPPCKHVQTCSNWTSLYRDPHTYSNLFNLEFTVQGPPFQTSSDVFPMKKCLLVLQTFGKL